MTEEQSDVQNQSEDVKNTETPDQSESTTDNDNPFKKPPKRKKVKKLAEAEESSTNQNNDEEGNVIPAPPPSKRQKKRQKQAQVTVRNKDVEIEKTISYLTKWDANRDEWKYEKLRQIYIQKNIFDENIIPTEHCEIAIKYLSTSQGHARKIIVEAAEAIMKEVEEKITDENQEELTSSARYERAREILQSMLE